MLLKKYTHYAIIIQLLYYKFYWFPAERVQYFVHHKNLAHVTKTSVININYRGALNLINAMYTMACWRWYLQNAS